MSDEEQSKVVDNITPNGENAFTNPRLGIAFVVKPMLTAGDMERWLKDVEVKQTQPSIVDRMQMLFGAVKAGIIVHSTDKLTAANVRELDGDKANWYGAMLTIVYNRYQFIDPN